MNILFMIKIYGLNSDSYKEIRQIIDIVSSIPNNKLYMENKVNNINELSSIINNNNNNNNVTFIDEIGDIDIQLCITYGGDGVVLWGHKMFTNKEKLPKFFSIDSGTISFLCNFNIKNNQTLLTINNILKNNINNNLFINKFRRINLVYNDKIYYGLNEVILERKNVNPLKIDIFVNDKIFLSNVMCDGILFTLGVGSTAYNSSIAGPFMDPSCDSFILNAIAPFGINFKPLVLNKKFKIKLKFNTHNYTEGRVVIDGNNYFDFNKDSECLLSIGETFFECKIIRLF